MNAVAERETLPALAAKIRQLDHEARGLASAAIDRAIQAGEILAEVKRRLPHGEFGKWVAANCGFGERTAQRYLRAFEHRAELPAEGGLAAALDSIAGAKCDIDVALLSPRESGVPPKTGDLSAAQISALLAGARALERRAGDLAKLLEALDQDADGACAEGNPAALKTVIDVAGLLQREAMKTQVYAARGLGARGAGDVPETVPDLMLPAARKSPADGAGLGVHNEAKTTARDERVIEPAERPAR